MPRIVEAVLCLVNEGQRRGFTLTQYDIAKSIFLADRAHLNRFGRPITFDNYEAMENGPVPGTTYGILKEEASALRKYGRALPWSRRKAPEIGKKCYAYESPARGEDADILSPSDIEQLHDALATVKSLGFSQVKRLTHQDPAYRAAWRARGERKSSRMRYAMLFDRPNEERAEELSFISKHV